MNRSTWAFCHGACGAVRTTSIPMAFAVAVIAWKARAAVVNEIARRLIPRKCFAQLLRGPGGN